MPDFSLHIFGYLDLVISHASATARTSLSHYRVDYHSLYHSFVNGSSSHIIPFCGLDSTALPICAADIRRVYNRHTTYQLVLWMDLRNLQCRDSHNERNQKPTPKTVQVPMRSKCRTKTNWQPNDVEAKQLYVAPKRLPA